MKLQGNNIFSEDEERIARYLKENNLAYTNRISRRVMPKKTFYTRFGKRGLDLIIAALALIILSPAYFTLSVINLIVMGRPIIYKQTRTGYMGNQFNIFKFRSMKDTVDKEGRQLPAEQRLTKYGRFIRRTSLDELPNIFNILRGEMSFIGPRPLPVFYSERMSEKHRKRELVRPGLECPRMIELDEEFLGYYQVQYENDIWYVENISFITDMKMIIALVKMTFTLQERKKHADVGTFFVGYNDNGSALSLRMAKEQYPEQFKLGI